MIGNLSIHDTILTRAVYSDRRYYSKVPAAVGPRRDKLERESTSTAAVESTLANVISSCLEGSATRKLGKVRPAARTAGRWSVLARWRAQHGCEARERERERRKKRGSIRVRGCIVALMAAGIKHSRACTRSTMVVYSATIYVDNFEMESDVRQRAAPAVRRWSGSGLVALAKYEIGGGGGARFADLFGRAREAGRLGWVERRRAESRTRFKRKVLRVNGAEVMLRPQQQQPSLARSLPSVPSSSRSFSLTLYSVLSASLTSWRKRER